MSNVKHPNCAMRSLANEAKERLKNNDYKEPSAPKFATPQQKEIFLKLQEMLKQGEEIVNPIAQRADREKRDSLPHDQKQRYIMQLAADYVSMRTLINEKKSS